MASDLLVETLRHRLHGSDGISWDRPGLSPSAILILVFFRDGEYYLVLNKRTDLVEFHKGEICFPGGTKDPRDSSPRETALREASEEMGINRDQVTIVGSLDAVVTRTNFLIIPVVGLINYPYSFRINVEEVADVLEVPIKLLADPRHRPDDTLPSEGSSYSYVYDFQGHSITGATARILTQFLDLFAGDLGRMVYG